MLLVDTVDKKIYTNEEIKEKCGIDISDEKILRQIITENMDKYLGD